MDRPSVAPMAAPASVPVACAMTVDAAVAVLGDSCTTSAAEFGMPLQALHAFAACAAEDAIDVFVGDAMDACAADDVFC